MIVCRYKLLKTCTIHDILCNLRCIATLYTVISAVNNRFELGSCLNAAPIVGVGTYLDRVLQLTDPVPTLSYIEDNATESHHRELVSAYQASSTFKVAAYDS